MSIRAWRALLAGVSAVGGMLGGWLAEPAAAQTPLPVGAQSLANLTLTGNQDEAVVAIDPTGNFLVVWRDEFLDGSLSAIVGRRFSARTGQPLSNEFLINVSPAGDQRNPAVAMADDGRFVVVWEGPDTAPPVTPGIFGSLRQANGAAIVAEFAVNTGTGSIQRRPAVAMQPGGGFLVVWQDNSPTPGRVDTGENIAGRLYPANFPSAPPGNPVLLNTSLAGDQEQPAVTPRPDVAGWLVGWQGPRLFSPPIPSILVRLLDDNLGGSNEVNVNTSGSADQRAHVALAANAQGGAIVVWEAPDENFRGIFGRRFIAGVPGAAEEQINLTTGFDEREPTVAIDQQGGFVTAWVVASPALADPWDELPEGSPIIIHGRRRTDGPGFRSPDDPQAPPPDSEFQINSSGSSFADPWVAIEPRGNFIVAWQGTDLADPDGNGVFYRGFRDALFADDFETANTARWSATVP